MNGRFSIKCGPPLKKASQKSSQPKKTPLKIKNRDHITNDKTQVNSSKKATISKSHNEEKKSSIDENVTPRKAEKPIQTESNNFKSNNEKPIPQYKSKIQKQYPIPQRKKQALSQIQQTKVAQEPQRKSNLSSRNQTPQQKQKIRQSSQLSDQQSDTQKTPQSKISNQFSQDILQLNDSSNFPNYYYGLPEDQNLSHDELIQTYNQLAAEYKKSLEKRKSLQKESKEIKTKISDAYSVQESIEKEIMDNAKSRMAPFY